MKIVYRLLVIGLLGCVFISCDKEEFVANADGDAFIVSKITGTGAEADTVYGLALHAFGNKDFSKVEATLPGGSKIELHSYNNYTYDYYYETGEDQFTPDLPTPGNYDFSFSFRSGESDTSGDQLTDDVVYPVAITRAAYNATDVQIELEWNNAEGDVDYYAIFMEKEDGDVVYVSKALRDVVTHNISGSTYTWVNGETPVNGEAYTIFINAYKYEAAEGTDMNVQAKSMATATVVWNPGD